MSAMNELFQTADWKAEKHVPVIEFPVRVKKGEVFHINVTVGKQIQHPNTTQHHIAWIEVFFLPKGEKFPYCIGRSEFSSHGSSVQGADTSTLYVNPEAAFAVKTEKPGEIIASSYCNIHGLWQSSAAIEVI